MGFLRILPLLLQRGNAAGAVFLYIRACKERLSSWRVPSDLYKYPSAASDNLDVARYARDYFLCGKTFIRHQINKLFFDNSLASVV